MFLSIFKKLHRQNLAETRLFHVFVIPMVTKSLKTPSFSLNVWHSEDKMFQKPRVKKHLRAAASFSISIALDAMPCKPSCATMRIIGRKNKWSNRNLLGERECKNRGNSCYLEIWLRCPIGDYAEPTLMIVMTSSVSSKPTCFSSGHCVRQWYKCHIAMWRNRNKVTQPVCVQLYSECIGVSICPW